MAEKAKILLVLFEGLPDTVIDSQVLLHARHVRESLALEVVVWAFACTAPLMAKSLARRDYAAALAGSEVAVFRGVRPAFPASTMINGLLLLWRLWRRRREIGVIHARTDYTAATAGRVGRLLGIPVIWDCRGDAVAEFRERFRPGSALGRLLAGGKCLILEAQRRGAARLCSAAIFVSRPLAALAAPVLGDKPREIIPCVAAEEIFAWNPELRASVRAALGFGESELVFIYSGSLAPYQGFDEMLELFRALAERQPAARLLVLTPAAGAARGRMAGLPAACWQLRSAPLVEMNGYLNAADLGFMLRRECGTNRVASPTKFAEYCLTGLPVVMTDSIRDSFELAEQLGNRVAPDRIEHMFGAPPPDRARVAGEARRLLTRSAMTERYRRLYRPSEPGPGVS